MLTTHGHPCLKQPFPSFPDTLGFLHFAVGPSLFFFFFTFYFILEYSQLTVVWYIHMYPFSPRLPSHLCCHITLNRVLCAIQEVLVDYSFYIEQCAHVQPKALRVTFTHLSLLVTISVSKSVYVFSISSFASFLCRFLQIRDAVWYLFFWHDNSRGRVPRSVAITPLEGECAGLH